jgi:hypothetical protein
LVSTRIDAELWNSAIQQRCRSTTPQLWNSGIPHRWRSLGARIVDVLARLLIFDELLAGLGMLPLCETRKLLGAYLAGKAPLLGELALPLAPDLISQCVVALLGAGKFIGVIRRGLARAQRFRDGDHDCAP